jgi:hypothetical protein
MDVLRLEHFLAVADEGSLTGGAQGIFRALAADDSSKYRVAAISMSRSGQTLHPHWP